MIAAKEVRKLLRVCSSAREARLDIGNDLIIKVVSIAERDGEQPRGCRDLEGSLTSPRLLMLPTRLLVPPAPG